MTLSLYNPARMTSECGSPSGQEQGGWTKRLMVPPNGTVLPTWLSDAFSAAAAFISARVGYVASHFLCVRRQRSTCLCPRPPAAGFQARSKVPDNPTGPLAAVHEVAHIHLDGHFFIALQSFAGGVSFTTVPRVPPEGGYSLQLSTWGGTSMMCRHLQTTPRFFSLSVGHSSGILMRP